MPPLFDASIIASQIYISKYPRDRHHPASTHQGYQASPLLHHHIPAYLGDRALGVELGHGLDFRQAAHQSYRSYGSDKLERLVWAIW